MKLRYDDDADALYLRLNDEQFIESEEVEPNVVLDFNEQGEVVGVEILRIKDRVPVEKLNHINAEPE